MIQFSVTNMTVCGNVGVSSDLSLDLFFELFEPCETFSYAEMLHEGLVVSKGSRTIPVKKTKKKKVYFKNQVTIVSDAHGSNVNVKLFQNGNVLVAGVTSETQASEIVSALKSIVSNAFETDPQERPLKICMINSGMKLPRTVDPHKLYERLNTRKDGVFAVYEPCIYSGVKIRYFYNEERPGVGTCKCSIPCGGKGKAAGEGPCKKVWHFYEGTFSKALFRKKCRQKRTLQLCFENIQLCFENIQLCFENIHRHSRFDIAIFLHSGHHRSLQKRMDQHHRGSEHRPSSGGVRISLHHVD